MDQPGGPDLSSPSRAVTHREYIQFPPVDQDRKRTETSFTDINRGAGFNRNFVKKDLVKPQKLQTNRGYQWEEKPKTATILIN